MSEGPLQHFRLLVEFVRFQDLRARLASFSFFGQCFALPPYPVVFIIAIQLTLRVNQR
jgi:hypothetical protein